MSQETIAHFRKQAHKDHAEKLRHHTDGDIKQDQALIRKAFAEHDEQLHHNGKTRLKFKEGGCVPGDRKKKRLDRANGGKAKAGHKTVVNVVMPQHAGQAPGAGAAPPMIPPKPPMMPPPGAGPGGPGAGGPPMPPPGPPGGGMMRKRGGRVKKAWGGGLGMDPAQVEAMRGLGGMHNEMMRRPPMMGQEGGQPPMGGGLGMQQGDGSGQASGQAGGLPPAGPGWLRGIEGQLGMNGLGRPPAPMPTPPIQHPVGEPVGQPGRPMMPPQQGGAGGVPPQLQQALAQLGMQGGAPGMPPAQGGAAGFPPAMSGPMRGGAPGMDGRPVYPGMMARKRGGKIPSLDAGSGGGKGREEKIAAYGSNKPHNDENKPFIGNDQNLSASRKAEHKKRGGCAK